MSRRILPPSPPCCQQAEQHLKSFQRQAISPLLALLLFYLASLRFTLLPSTLAAIVPVAAESGYKIWQLRLFEHCCKQACAAHSRQWHSYFHDLGRAT